MKRGMMTHPKLKKFARKLGVELATAAGYLEFLWHFTADKCPQGDIGRFDDDDIAEAATSPSTSRPSAEFVGALIDCRLIDRHEKHRLIVHDWSEHADRAVHRRLNYQGLKFADGFLPFHRTGKREDEASETPSSPKPSTLGDQNGNLGDQWTTNGHQYARAQPEPVPEPVPEPIHTSVVVVRGKETSASKTSEEARANSFSVDDDDDESALAVNPRKVLIAVMQKATRQAPDKKILRDIETALSKAGSSVAAFVRDVKQRIPRLMEPPKLGFFLQQARDFGETAAGEVSKTEFRESIVMAKVISMQPPKVTVEPTAGCGCVGGIIKRDGKFSHCDCPLGIGIQNQKRTS